MNMKKSVRFNFVMNIFLTVSNMIYPLITFPYVSRVLGAEGVGIVQYANTTVTYFITLAMLGIPTYGVRAIAQVQNDLAKRSKTAIEILVMNTISAIISFVVFMLLLMNNDMMREHSEVYLILSTSIFLSSLGVEWFFQGIEEYAYITVRSVVSKFLAIAAMFLLIQDQNDYVFYALTIVIAAYGLHLLNLMRLFKMIDFSSVSLRRLNIKRHLKPVFTFFALTISTTIYSNIDTTLIGYFQGVEEVGYYTSAIKVKNLLVGIVAALGTVLLPRLSLYIQENNMKAFSRMIRISLNFILLITVPLSLFIMVYAKEIILFLSGQDFLSGTLPLQIIIFSIILIGMSNVTGIQILVPSNKENVLVFSTMIGAIVSLILNVIFVQIFGTVGAAITNVLAELTVLLVQFMYIRRTMSKLSFDFNTVKIFGAGLLAMIVSIVIRGLISYEVHLVIQLMVGAIIFGLIYLVTLLLVREEQLIDLINQYILKKG